jgi:hypothetical protein
VILTTLTLLLLAITGITMAGESTIGPESGSQTEPTIQDATTTTVEPTDTTVWETTNITDEGHPRRSEPAARSVTEDSTGPEADELEVTGEEATEAEGKKGGKPEGVGKPESVGVGSVGNGKARDGEGEAKGDGGTEKKVTLCHKGKSTIRVGEPAVATHQSHEDSLGPCQTEEAAPEPPEETPGAMQNGDGGGGNGQQKVMLCHKGKTLTVAEPALAAHLRHSDTEGPCAGQ